MKHSWQILGSTWSKQVSWEGQLIKLTHPLEMPFRKASSSYVGSFFHWGIQYETWFRFPLLIILFILMLINLLNQARICFSENLVLPSQMWRSAGVRKEPVGKYFEVTFETRSNTLNLYLVDLRKYLMHLIVFNVEKQGRFWGQLQVSFSQLELTQLFSELLVQRKITTLW